MPRFLFSLLVAGVVASSANASVTAPSLRASTPEQWNAFTQSAVQAGDFVAFRNRLEQRIHAELPASAVAKLDEPPSALAVAQWRFLHETLADDADALATVGGGTDGKEFLAWLMGNREALEEYLGLTGIIPVKTPRGPGLEGWREIWRTHPEARASGLWMRVSAACAVVFSSPRNGVTASERFGFYYESHRKGKLVPSFDRATSFDLALTVGGCGHSNDDLEWAQDTVPKDKKDQVNVGGYGHALVAYRGNNYRGVSVQDGRYYDQKKRTLALIMEYGGVCGAVSTINAAVANAHGVPAFTAGQPGHCAYVWKRDDQTWSGGNFVSGWSETASPHTQGFWLGDKSASVNLVSAAVDAPGFVRGARLRWLASAWRARNPAAAHEILTAATAANPLDYGAWPDRVDAALAWTTAPARTWPAMAAGIIEAFPKFPMAINDLLGRFETEKLFPRYSAKERIAYAIAAAKALTGEPAADQWDLIYTVWKPWLARQLTGFGLQAQAAQATVEADAPAEKDAWEQLSLAERPAVESFFAAILPAIQTNQVVAKGVTAAWVALVAQDPAANARAAAYFQKRVADSSTLRELNTAAEAALFSIRSSPDARADMAVAIRQRLKSLAARG